MNRGKVACFYERMPTISKGRIVELTATDLWDYQRNPVQTLAAWKQGVSPRQLFPPSLVEQFLAKRGDAFEGRILAKYQWLPTETTVQEAFQKKIQLTFMKPRLEHEKARVAGVRLFGVPDIVRFVRSRNGIEPHVIDIKSHKTLQDTDQVQVALYCFVLAKMLAIRYLPAGYIRLRTENEEIKKQHLLNRLEPVDVNFYHGELCRRVEEILSEFERPQRTGVLAVHGIGIKAKRILERERITTLEHLAEVNDEELMTRLKSKYPLSSRGSTLASSFASIYQYQGKDEVIRRWKHRARAILQGKPLVFDSRPLPSAPLEIYFDLEYDNGFGEKEKRRLWLASLLISRQGACEIQQFFAATQREERKLLERLLPLLTSPNAMIVTYAGTMADLPTLKDALSRHGYDISVVKELKRERHLDLFSFLQSSVALPLSEESFAAGYGLKVVETIFGIPRHIQMDGFEALMKYHEYLRVRSGKKKRAIKKTLLAYAAEDVQNLRELKDRLSEFMRGGASVTSDCCGHSRND